MSNWWPSRCLPDQHSSARPTVACCAALLLSGLLTAASAVIGCQSGGNDALPSMDEQAMRPNGSRRLRVVFIDGVPVPVASLSALAAMPVAPSEEASDEVAPPPPTPGEVRWRVPAGWAATPPASQMRAAQYTIPRAQGDEADAELAVYYFGPQGAGEPSETLDRWASAFTSTQGEAKKTQLDRAHVVEVSGTYGGAHVTGAAAPEPTRGWGLLGAVVQTAAGPYYFKMLGPARTVAAAREGFFDIVRSVGMGEAPAGSVGGPAASSRVPGVAASPRR